MEKIKIYKDSFGDKFVKVEIKFIIDVPVDEDLKDINKDEVYDALMNIDSSDLANEIFDHFDEYHIITKSDKIKHIEKEYTSQIIELCKPIEIEYLTFDLFEEIVKSQIHKGYKFAEIAVASNQCFSLDNLEKIKAVGFNIYRQNDKYWITWTDFK